MNWTTSMRAAFDQAGIKPTMGKNAGIKPIKEWNAHVSYRTSIELRNKGILV